MSEQHQELQQVATLVAAWFAGDYLMFDAVTDAPELAWLAILQIAQQELTDEQKSLLAGGPIESLLAWHGSDFIERVLVEAERNPKFNQLLGGVWRLEMPLEIWARIEKARKEVW